MLFTASRPPVAALLTAGLLAGCAGATTSPSPSQVASQPAPQASSTPAPSVEPTAAPTNVPTEAPTLEPGPSDAVEPTRFEVPLTTATAHTVTAVVIDWTGNVTVATSGTPGDGASVSFDAVQIANDGLTTLVLTWVGGPCDATPAIVWGATTATITVVQEPCQGDAIGFDRIVRLDLAQPVTAASVTGVLQSGGDAPGG
jgi:hypothetical protein